MNLRKSIRVLCWAVLLIPLVVSSTPPALSLWAYRIRGVVLDGTGTPLSGIPVALAGKCYPDSLLLLHPGRISCGYIYPDKGIPSTLTDQQGRFYLDVFSGTWFDSLAVAVVFADTFITGEFFDIDSARANYEVTEPVLKEDEGYLCDDSMYYEEKHVGWAFAFLPDTLVVGPALLARDR